MKARKIVLVFFCLLAATFINATCSRQMAKTSLEHSKYIGAKALVTTSAEVKDYLKNNTESLCKDILEEHKAEIEAGTYSKEQADQDCVAKIIEINEKFDSAMAACYHSFMTFEKSLDIWDALDAKAKLKAIGATINIVYELIKILDEAAVPIPKIIDDYVGYLKLIGDSLEEM